MHPLSFRRIERYKAILRLALWTSGDFLRPGPHKVEKAWDDKKEEKYDEEAPVDLAANLWLHRVATVPAEMGRNRRLTGWSGKSGVEGHRCSKNPHVARMRWALSRCAM